MREEVNLKELIGLNPDFVGFIFYNRSPRFVGENFKPIELPNDIKKVGVFVNESVEEVIRLAGKYKLDFVQLHSNESPAFCQKIKQTGLGILKSVAVGDKFDFEELKSYQKSVDYFLFDTQGKGYGGHGRAFDWKVLRAYDLNIPFFVAGGISNENVRELLDLDHPQFVAIDVNSKYESSPGVKDIDKLKELFSIVRNGKI